ncbi:MAG: hypothetical protein JWP97_3510 [Labilithrix sp.]|nr:hypothetical protein [Labilithrix sp.]
MTVAAAEERAPRWRDGLVALAVATSIAGAGLGFSYAGLLTLTHVAAGMLYVGASFVIQAFAALVAARACLGTPPRAALAPFVRTLWPQEIMFVGLVGLSLCGVGAREPGGLLVLGCLVWQAALTFRFFQALAPARSAARAALALLAHYAVIFVLVGTYAHVQDLFPYPRGVL